MKKIVYISGSRSDYSAIKRTLFLLNKKTDLTIITTSMHLSSQFGYTAREIQNDGFKIKIIDMLLDNDSLGSMAKSLGIGLYGITQALEELNPELVFLEGDRGETLAGAIAAAHLNIPIIHHGGGDVSGSIDDKIRNAISSFSDYHLVGNQKSYDKLIDSGLNPKCVFNVGEPGIDDIIEQDFTTPEEIIKKYGIDSTRPLILLIYHPDTNETKKIKKEMREIFDALDELKIPVLSIYANSDAGGRIINAMLEEQSKKSRLFSIYTHIGRRDFLGLLNICTVMIGNSSAGIIELPSFKKPFICLGSRQKNRLRAGNTIDVNADKKEILETFSYVTTNARFKNKIKKIQNPYGQGNTSEKITDKILYFLRRNNGNN